jgi:hypothetical protein
MLCLLLSECCFANDFLPPNNTIPDESQEELAEWLLYRLISSNLLLDALHWYGKEKITLAKKRVYTSAMREENLTACQLQA